jgi:hypothetical protein
MNEFVFKYVDLKGLGFILNDKTLKFTNPSDFNDPFEFHVNLVDRRLSPRHILEIYKKYDKNITREKIKRYKKEIKNDSKHPDSELFNQFEKRKKDTKVSCFSEISDNILMWSHYADKHHGVCIEFDSKLLKKSFKEDSMFCKTNYIKRIKTKKLSKHKEKAIQYWISSKGKEWKYEKETRIILGSQKEDTVPFDINSIRGIIFGCNLTEDEKIDCEKLIFDDKKYNWIKTSEMIISEFEYKLIRNIRR